MKRITALLASLALLLAGMTALAPEASAKVDRRPCVSKPEFRQAHRPMTQAQIRSIFDVSGVEIQRFEDYIYDGYWESYYTDDGYYDYVDYDGDGLWDDAIWVDTSYWTDYWVDTSYWMIDTFRTYTKCHDRNFDRGHGRVALNFDNYTSPYSGMRVYSKYRNNPWVGWARSIVDAKPKPANKTAKNTPAPHRNLKRTVIKK